MNERKGEKKHNRSLFSFGSVSGIGMSSRLFKNPVSAFFTRMSDSFVYSSTRSYGIAALSYGIVSIFIYFAKFYAVASASAAYWILGLVLAAIGVILICFDKPMCIALQEFPITDYVLFEFFLIKRMNRNDNVKPIPPFLGIAIGVIPALVSIFVEPIYVLLALLLFVFVIASFVTPEFPLIFGLLIAPYLSPVHDKEIALAALALLSFVSFVRKVALGKRVYNVSVYDLIILFLLIFLTIGGAVNRDMPSALVVMSLTLAYIPASNLIVNRRLSDCAVNAIIASSVPIALMGIVEFIMSFFGHGIMGDNLIFSSVGAYGAYSLISAVFSFVAFTESRRFFRKTIFGVILALHAVSIILSMNTELWLAVAATVAAYFVVKATRVKKELLLVLLLLPYLLFSLPDSVLNTASEILGMERSLVELASELRRALDAFVTSPVFGVGKNSFDANLPVSLMVSFGAVVSLLFGASILLATLEMSQLARQLRESDVHSIGESSMLAMFSAAAFGVLFNVFSDVSVYFLFVSVFGIFKSAMRIAKTEYDERLGYFGDQRSDDSYVVDMRIVK